MEEPQREGLFEWCEKTKLNILIELAIQIDGLIREQKMKEQPEEDLRTMGKPTIDELEALLDKDEDIEIEILPNGEIRARGGSTSQEIGTRKVLTMREKLGGEYSECRYISE